MLAPYWVLFVLLSPLLHQFDSQQPFTIAYENLVKPKPFVLKHCKESITLQWSSTILRAFFVVFCQLLRQFDSQQPFTITYEFLVKTNFFVLSTAKNQHLTLVLAPYWFLFVLLCPLLHHFDSQQPFTITYDFLVESKLFVIKLCKKNHHLTVVLAPYWVLFV